MNRRVMEVEDRLTMCQENWQNEMREVDNMKVLLNERKQEPKVDIEWK